MKAFKNILLNIKEFIKAHKISGPIPRIYSIENNEIYLVWLPGTRQACKEAGITVTREVYLYGSWAAKGVDILNDYNDWNADTKIITKEFMLKCQQGRVRVKGVMGTEASIYKLLKILNKKCYKKVPIKKFKQEIIKWHNSISEEKHNRMINRWLKKQNMTIRR